MCFSALLIKKYESPQSSDMRKNSLPVPSNNMARRRSSLIPPDPEELPRRMSRHSIITALRPDEVETLLRVPEPEINMAALILKRLLALIVVLMVLAVGIACRILIVIDSPQGALQDSGLNDTMATNWTLPLVHLPRSDV